MHTVKFLSLHDLQIFVFLAEVQKQRDMWSIKAKQWQGGGKGEKWEERKKGKISSSTLWHASSVLSSHYISLMGAQQCVCVFARKRMCERESESDEPLCQSDL